MEHRFPGSQVSKFPLVSVSFHWLPKLSNLRKPKCSIGDADVLRSHIDTSSYSTALAHEIGPKYVPYGIHLTTVPSLRCATSN